jgi:hypothetical protein
MECTPLPAETGIAQDARATRAGAGSRCANENCCLHATSMPWRRHCLAMSQDMIDGKESELNTIESAYLVEDTTQVMFYCLLTETVFFSNFCIGVLGHNRGHNFKPPLSQAKRVFC